MTKPQRISLIVFVGLLLACIVAVIVYDVWVATSHQDNTISWSMAVWAVSSPFAVFWWGFITGGVVGGLSVHFFKFQMISPIDFAEMQRLRAENVQLAAENASLEAEVDRLRDRVATLMMGGDGEET